jgi:hypothetical protein
MSLRCIISSEISTLCVYMTWKYFLLVWACTFKIIFQRTKVLNFDRLFNQFLLFYLFTPSLVIKCCIHLYSLIILEKQFCVSSVFNQWMMAHFILATLDISAPFLSPSLKVSMDWLLHGPAGRRCAWGIHRTPVPPVAPRWAVQRRRPRKEGSRRDWGGQSRMKKRHCRESREKSFELSFTSPATYALLTLYLEMRWHCHPPQRVRSWCS